LSDVRANTRGTSESPVRGADCDGDATTPTDRTPCPDVRLLRHGSGYIRDGTPVVVTGRSCHLPHLVTAVRIDPLD
jgi:hypothetical protein